MILKKGELKQLEGAFRNYWMGSGSLDSYIR